MAARLLDILNDERLMVTPCNVFTGENLCYLFVGRPSYKVPASENPSEWQLPVVFVLRFAHELPIKRIFPFDSGAFVGKRLPNYITCFNINNYDVSENKSNIGRLVSIFFGDDARYIKRRSFDISDIKERHEIDARHQEIAALARLYREDSNANLDDRAAAIELQITEDIYLTSQNVLGIVMPSEYARIPGFRDSIFHITDTIETYDLHPLNSAGHYGLIYEAVNNIYRRYGLYK